MKDIVGLGISLFTGFLIFKCFRTIDDINFKKKRKLKKRIIKKKRKGVKWKDHYGMNLEEIKFI